MSSHIFSDEQLIAFALGELDPSQSEHIASHIVECPQCRATIASLRELRAFLREDDTVAAPPVTVTRAQAIFRQHASLSRPGWLDVIRRGSQRRARQFAGVSTLASILLALTLLYGSARLVAPAVQATVPGDALYPVKTTIEDVRVVAALDDGTRVQAQLSIARARVTEINTLVAQGRYDLLPQTTQDYSAHVQQATATLDQVLKQNPGQVAPGQIALAQKAEQDLASYEVSLAALQENSPGNVKPQIRQAVIASAAAKSTVQNRLSNISSPSNVTPAAPIAPGPGAVVTGSSAPASPAATNTLAPAPTIVIPQPGAVTTPAVVTNSPTTVSTGSKPTSSPSPIPSTQATHTTIPGTSTPLSTRTSVAPTGTPAATMTSAPTSTAGPTATASATTPSATSRPSATTAPTATLAPSTPTLVPSTSTPALSTASQTATSIAPSPTPITASVTSTPSLGPTLTPSALPTSTSSSTSGSNPSLTVPPVPDPTTIPPVPTATTAPIATYPAPGGITPVSVTPSASSVITLAAPTPNPVGGANSPSAGAGSAGGTKPLPATPSSSISFTPVPIAPPAGSGASATSIPPAAPSNFGGAPTIAPIVPATSSPVIAPIATTAPPVQTNPTAIPPAKVATPTPGLLTNLISVGIIILTH